MFVNVRVTRCNDCVTPECNIRARCVSTCTVLSMVEGSLCAIEGDFQWSEFQSVRGAGVDREGGLQVRKAHERQNGTTLLGRLTPTRFGGEGKGGDSSRPRLIRQTLVLRACLRLPLPQNPGFRKLWRSYGRGH